MGSAIDEMREAFIVSGVKTVSHTDISKGAYVPDERQRLVMKQAGYEPVSHTENRIIPIKVAGTDEILETTYYSSVRTGSGRTPEIRMGRGLVHWLGIGDRLLLGTDGVNVFALKLKTIESVDAASALAAVAKVYEQIDPKRLLAKAKQGRTNPKQKSVQTVEYERDLAVRAFAIHRANGHCETPGCGYKGFKTDNGELFIEVHHIKALGQGGEDTIWNTAAICPNCHRYAHYSVDRAAFEERLRKAVEMATKQLVANIESRS